jgi:Ca2+-binding RTX toxin-like protein
MRFFRNTRLVLFCSVVLLVVLILVISLSALAAKNTVSSSRVGMVTRARLIAELRPPGCAGMTLVNIVYCTGTNKCNGTNQGDLILGDSANNNIDGKNGADCIIAGGGDDTVDGSNGADICIEGPGNDSYTSCKVVNP